MRQDRYNSRSFSFFLWQRLQMFGVRTSRIIFLVLVVISGLAVGVGWAAEPAQPLRRSIGRAPKFDPALVKDDVVEIGVQVNGKLRGVIELAVNADEATARAAALAEPKVQVHVEGKTLKKLVYVPGKIINVIVA